MIFITDTNPFLLILSNTNHPQIISTLQVVFIIRGVFIVREPKLESCN